MNMEFSDRRSDLIKKVLPCRVPFGQFKPNQNGEFVFPGQGSRLWEIRQVKLTSTLDWHLVGFSSMTMLLCYNTSDLGTFSNPDCVMEDGLDELSKHLGILTVAKGKVLVTGLGLGCVVRGLLANPEVTAIDVVEKDKGIIDNVWPEFAGSRAIVHHADAFNFKVRGRWWDYAWHDLHVFGDDLQLIHMKLLKKYRYHVGRQGAWALPRTYAKAANNRFGKLIGSPKIKDRLE